MNVVGFVYAITVHDRSGAPVKIGFTTDLHARVRTLQTSCWEPLAIVAVRPGAPDDERTLHATFESARIRGEWFQRTADVDTFIVTNACTPITAKTRLPALSQPPWTPLTIDEPPLLKADAVAALLNRRTRDVIRLARAGQIAFVDVGAGSRTIMRFRHDAVAAFIKKRST